MKSKLLSKMSKMILPELKIAEVNIKETRHGFGLFSLIDAPANTTLLKVDPIIYLPYSAQNAIMNAKENPQFYSALLEFVKRNSNSIKDENTFLQSLCLSLNLMIQYQNKLPYAEFLYSLEFNHPLTMQPDDPRLQALQHTWPGRKIHLHQLMFNTFISEVLGASNADTFLKAVSLVESRGLSNNDFPMTMCPILDFSNHGESNEVNAKHELQPDGSISLTTTTDININDEIFISYGDNRDAASFLTLYGFVPESTYNDTMEILFPAQNEDDLQLKRSRISLSIKDAVIGDASDQRVSAILQELLSISRKRSSGNEIDAVIFLEQILNAEIIKRTYNNINNNLNKDDKDVWMKYANNIFNNELKVLEKLLEIVGSYRKEII